MSLISEAPRDSSRSEAPQAEDSTAAPQVSIVMPCLNEAETLAACIAKARRALRESGLAGEIIVADNGSTDGSPAIAREQGARVISVSARGYGNALRAGIAAARGRYVIFGDADDSYNFLDVPRFVGKLQDGFDLVMGNRFRGGIHPGAMPWKHKYLGNPVLSGLGRLFFGCPVGDFHCGLRGFTREAYERMELCTAGMEFASEMVIKATLKGMRITEIPTKLFPDGRSRPPHLRSWRDGWRHLRFMLLLCPQWLFLIPGATLLLLGLFAGLLLLPGPVILGSVIFDIHTLLVAGLAVIVGEQLMIFAAYTKRLATLLGLHPAPNTPQLVGRKLSLECGIVIGTVLAAAGTALLAWSVSSWQWEGFGPLDPVVMMRRVIPAVVLIAIGIQTLFGSFFLGFLSLAQTRIHSAESH